MTGLCAEWCKSASRQRAEWKRTAVWMDGWMDVRHVCEVDLMLVTAEFVLVASTD